MLETSRTSKMVLDRTRVLGMTSSHAPVALFFLRAEQAMSQTERDACVPAFSAYRPARCTGSILCRFQGPG